MATPAISFRIAARSQTFCKICIWRLFIEWHYIVDPGASYYETRYRKRLVNNLHRRAKASDLFSSLWSQPDPYPKTDRGVDRRLFH